MKARRITRPHVRGGHQAKPITSLDGRQMSQPQPSMTLKVGDHWAICPVCDHRIRATRCNWSDAELGIKYHDWLLSKHSTDGAYIGRSQRTECTGSQTKVMPWDLKVQS